MAQEKEVSLTLFPPLKGGKKAYLHCRASAIARKTLRSGGGGGGGGGDREVPITGAGLDPPFPRMGVFSRDECLPKVRRLFLGICRRISFLRFTTLRFWPALMFEQWVLTVLT